MEKCNWMQSAEMIKYHDEEWGKPVYDDKTLFEFLILEGMQAGLTWSTILKRRETMREAFDNFDPYKIINYDNLKIEELMQNEGVIRNRLKLESLANNAKCFLEVKKEYGSFSNYLWGFVNNRTIVNDIKSIEDMPVVSPESKQLSSSLIKRGFKYVGPTICYAYMQAVGLVDDHLNTCVFKSTVNNQNKL